MDPRRTRSTRQPKSVATLSGHLWRCLLAAMLMPAAALGQGPAEPTLALALNQATFRPGDQLRVDVSVTNPGGGPLTDFFLLVRLPDGVTTASIRLGAGPVFGSLANLRSLWPLAPGINLGGPFAVGQTVFQYGFTGSEPQGSYLVYFAALRSGALANGRLDAGELLAVLTQSFVFTTEPGITTVEIDQAAVLLPQPGATRQLTATAEDGFGNPLPGPITWTSSRPDQVSVDSAGLVRAMVANGSSQIIAHAGGATSAPLLVIATLTPAGATLVTDAQIVGGPVETTPEAAPSADNTYRVVLRGVAPPVVGSLLINTGEQPVAGKVIAVDVLGADVMVTLGQASLPELFPALEIDEVLDLANVPVDVIPEVAAGYDVQRAGDTFTFTPKPGGAAAVAGDRQLAASVSALYPFQCESSIGMPIRLSAPPAFSLTFKPTLDVRYTTAGGLQRLVLNVTPTFKADVGVTVTAGFEGTITCDADLFTIPIPIGGPLSLVVGGLVPVGVGFEIGGSITAATLGAKANVETSTTASLGIACISPAGCGTVRDLGSPTLKAAPKLDLPSIGDLRLEPSLNVYGQMKLAIGNRFLKSLRLEAIKAKVGGKFQGSFAPAVTQIADASYRSDYKLGLSAKASVGPKIGEVAKRLGIGSITVLEASISTDLAKSPAPAATNPVTANRAAFTVGDTVTFTVRLDPATVDFFPVVGPYNVKTVVLVRGIGNPSVVGQVAAAPGQTVFTIPFAAPGPGSADQFTAFVLTQLLPLPVFALEIGKAVGPQVSIASSSVTAAVTAGFSGTPQQLSKSDPLFVTASLDPQPPQGSGAPDANASATGEIATENANHVLRLTGTASTSAEGSSLGTSAAASASLESRLIADLTGPFSCRFDVSWDPDTVRLAAASLTVRVLRDGVLVFQTSASVTNTQACAPGRYIVETSAMAGASSTSSSDDANGSGRFEVTVTLTP